METQSTNNLRVEAITALPTPDALKQALPASPAALDLVTRTRCEIEAVLDGKDPRLLVIVGPCSVHDPAAAMEYGERLAVLRKRLGHELLIVMRVYFEKPRTTLGWKGLINDPRLDGSCDVAAGLALARKLLLALLERGYAGDAHFNEWPRQFDRPERVYMIYARDATPLATLEYPGSRLERGATILTFPRSQLVEFVRVGSAP